jgi:hypothetical protein
MNHTQVFKQQQENMIKFCSGGTSPDLSINAGVAHEWSACPCRRTMELEQGNKPCVQEMPVLACELLIRRFEL